MSNGSRGGGIEVGGVEYFVDDRDGRRYYYDINALSNFVAERRASSASIRSRGSPISSSGRCGDAKEVIEAPANVAGDRDRQSVRSL